MICNRQIYNFFHHKNHQTTQDHRKKKGESERKNEAPPRLWCLGSFTPFDPTGTHTHTLTHSHAHTHAHTHSHRELHTYTQIHAFLQSRKHTLLWLTIAHRKQESLWGRCVISMSLSLVVKTAKHRMLGLHAAILTPPVQRNHGRALRRAC